MAVTSSILQLQKNLITFFHQKIISVGVYFTSFCSQINRFFLIIATNMKLHSLSRLQVVRFWQFLTTWGLESKRNIAFLTKFQKRFTWEQKLVCYLKYFWTYFSFFWNFFVAAKLSKWQAFWVQNTNGHCPINFWARSLKHGNFR